ncbi:AraC family transcriptional regulator [Stutzerimonas stutzeri]|uniref:AraC family transcriptional regulator n=1 Tax=Stutzerimonas stutzeri TaxID=316 RepID=W8QY31_STUST|nr:AraC family transcriptional regulator [Stutzerimonas stutzeri]AHL75515.1 AraC family transcriptional regulator [Stutzerimonas stutzeri]MCQ4327914.1 AraC family transcriptional regulator [Stutzerimonas stutzeri]
MSSHSPARVSASGSGRNDRLSVWQEERAKALIEASLGSSLSIAQLARECAQSRCHFSRAFQGTTGLSPQQWLTRRRIERAQQLLLGDSLLTRIAQDCGFADQAHFSRVFRRLVGSAPSQWRLSVLQDNRIANKRPGQRAVNVPAEDRYRATCR